MFGLDGLAAGAFGFLGGERANSSNEKIAAETSAFNAAEAQKNRDFQANMANTSYQRGMADMKAAGLNPLLAFSQGGASTPSGSSAQGVAARVENSALPAIQGLTSVMSTASQVAKNAADAKASLATAKNTDADTALLGPRFLLSEGQLRLQKDSNQREAEKHPSAKSLLDFQAKMNERYGEADKVLDMISKGAGSIGNVMDIFPQKKGKDALFDMWKKYQQNGKKLP